MQKMQGARGQSLLKPSVKPLDIHRGKPLQLEAAKCRKDVHTQQLGVAFLRQLPDLPPSLAWTANRNPVLGPCRKRDLIGRNMVANVNHAEKPPQFLLGVPTATLNGRGDRSPL